MTEENTVIQGNHKFLHISINTDNVKEILLYLYTEIDKLGKDIKFLNTKISEIQNPDQLTKITTRIDELGFDTNRRIDAFNTTVSSIKKDFSNYQTAIKDTIDQTTTKLHSMHKTDNDKLEQKIDELETRISDLSKTDGSFSNDNQQFEYMDNNINDLKQRVKQLEDFIKNPQKALSRPVFARSNTTTSKRSGNALSKDNSNPNRRSNQSLPSDVQLSSTRSSEQNSDNSKTTTPRQDTKRLSSSKNNKNTHSSKSIDNDKLNTNEQIDHPKPSHNKSNFPKNQTNEIKPKDKNLHHSQNQKEVHNIENQLTNGMANNDHNQSNSRSNQEVSNNFQNAIKSTDQNQDFRHSRNMKCSTNNASHNKDSHRSLISMNKADHVNDFENSMADSQSNNIKSTSMKQFKGKLPLLQLTHVNDPIILSIPPKSYTSRPNGNNKDTSTITSARVLSERRWITHNPAEKDDINEELDSLKNIMTRQTYHLASLTQPDSALNMTIERIVNQILENKGDELRTDTQSGIIQDLHDLRKNWKAFNGFMHDTKEKIENCATKDDLLLIANHIMKHCNNGADVYIDGTNNPQSGNTSISTKPCYCLACGRPKASVSSLSGNNRDNSPFFIDSDLQSLLSNSPILPGSQNFDTSIYKKGNKTFVPGANVKVLIGDNNSAAGKSIPLPKTVKNTLQPVIKKPTS